MGQQKNGGTEEMIGELGQRPVENIPYEQQRLTKRLIETQDLWNYNERSDICVIWLYFFEHFLDIRCCALCHAQFCFNSSNCSHSITWRNMTSHESGAGCMPGTTENTTHVTSHGFSFRSTEHHLCPCSSCPVVPNRPTPPGYHCHMQTNWNFHCRHHLTISVILQPLAYNTLTNLALCCWIASKHMNSATLHNG